jgi:hypothetical protein
LLRASSAATGEKYDLSVLTGTPGDGNIPHGALFVSFADAVLDDDDRRLAATRSEMADRLGVAALVDAAAVVATFNAIDRVADATGIPIEPAKTEATAGLRAALGIDAFARS